MPSKKANKQSPRQQRKTEPAVPKPAPETATTPPPLPVAAAPAETSLSTNTIVAVPAPQANTTAPAPPVAAAAPPAQTPISNTSPAKSVSVASPAPPEGPNTDEPAASADSDSNSVKRPTDDEIQKVYAKIANQPASLVSASVQPSNVNNTHTINGNSIVFEDEFYINIGSPDGVPALPEGQTAADKANINLIKIGAYKVPTVGTDHRLWLIAENLKRHVLEIPAIGADVKDRNHVYLAFMNGLEATLKELLSDATLTLDNVPGELFDMFAVDVASKFGELAKDPNMTPLLISAYDEHFKNVQVADPIKKMEWQRMQLKVAQIRAKQANMTWETGGLTPGEMRMLQRDAELTAAAALGNSSKWEEHYPNQEAVSYSWLCSVLMAHMADDMTDVMENVDRTKTALKFISLYATKSTKALLDALANWPNINTPNGVNIGPKLNTLVQSNLFVTAGDGGSNDDKHLSNAAVTTKRLNRLPYMFSSHKSVWGLMQRDVKNLVIELSQLYQLECDGNFRDMNSLSCLWYMCIGRHNMINPITDYNDKSGEDVLARLLGKQVRNAYGQSMYAYVWGMSKESVVELRTAAAASPDSDSRRQRASCVKMI